MSQIPLPAPTVLRNGDSIFPAPRRCGQSAHERIMKPLSPSRNRLYKAGSSLPGNDLAGASVNWLESTYSIPASVVLDTIKRKSGFSASFIVGFKIIIGIHAPGYDVNMGVLIHHLPVINASEEQVVLTSLLLQYAAHPFSIGWTMTTEPSNSPCPSSGKNSLRKASESAFAKLDYCFFSCHDTPPSLCLQGMDTPLSAAGYPTHIVNYYHRLPSSSKGRYSGSLSIVMPG